MADLPDNELFSAYLDGELTPAERAQMEQLLATNPAARQLLEELRSLSNEIQSLPKLKIGEDLVSDVLRASERRILLGDQHDSKPKRMESAPVPLVRSIFRRFTQPRIVVWTTLTAVFAVMIVLEEQRQDKPGLHARRETALVTEDTHAPLPPATIGAAPSKSNRDTASEKKTAEQVVSDVPEAAPSKLEANDASATAIAPLVAAPEPGSAGSTAADAAPSPSSGAAQPASVTSSVTRAHPTSRGTARPDEAKPTEAESLAQERTGGIPKYAAVMNQANVTEELMLVECEVTLEAVKEQAFDKLLVSNSIMPLADNMVSAPAAAESQTPVSGQQRKDTSDGELEVVYVEAEPEQVKATLAGLAASPKDFLSVSTQSVAGNELEGSLFVEYFARNTVAQVTEGTETEADKKEIPVEKSPAQQPAKPGAGGVHSSSNEVDSLQMSPRGFAQRLQGVQIDAGQNLTQTAVNAAIVRQRTNQQMPQNLLMRNGQRIQFADAEPARTSGPLVFDAKGGATPALAGAKTSPSGQDASRVEALEKQKSDLGQKPEPQAVKQRVVFVLRQVGRETPAASNAQPSTPPAKP